MNNKTTNLPQLRKTLNAPSVKAQFEKMLGNRASQFMTSIITVVSNNTLLQQTDINSIIMGAAISASMDLPIHPSLGYAALVPFRAKDEKYYAQFQLMTKGLTELFIRSGQCKSLICEIVRKGELVYKNKFTGEYVFDESKKKSDEIIGVMSAFELINGYKKVEYMTVNDVKQHAQRYSQSYRKDAAIWKDNWEEMMKKTCLKRLLVRWAPKSIEMQKMAIFNDSVVKGDIEDIENAQAVYEEDNANVEEVNVVEEVHDTSDKSSEVIDEGSGEILEVNDVDDDF